MSKADSVTVRGVLGDDRGDVVPLAVRFVNHGANSKKVDEEETAPPKRGLLALSGSQSDNLSKLCPDLALSLLQSLLFVEVTLFDGCVNQCFVDSDSVVEVVCCVFVVLAHGRFP